MYTSKCGDRQVRSLLGSSDFYKFYYLCNQYGHVKLDESLYKHLGT